VLADVSANLLDQFVACLEQKIVSEDPTPEPEAAEPAEPEPAEVPPAPAPEAATSERPGVRTIDSPEAEPIDLARAAGTPVAKRVGPVLALLAVAWLLRRLLRRSR